MKSIVVNVTYTMRPGTRERFVEAVTSQGVLASIRAEQGCVQYEYFAAVEDPDKLFLLEVWADQAALDAHMQSPGMAQLQQIKKEYVLGMQRQQY